MSRNVRKYLGIIIQKFYTRLGKKLGMKEFRIMFLKCRRMFENVRECWGMVRNV